MDFLMVIMASCTHDNDGVMQDGSHTLPYRLTDIQPWFISYFFDIGRPYMSNIKLDKDIQIAQLDS